MKPARKSGDEPFHGSATSPPPHLSDFWAWSASDLVSNAQRGVLAEFIVAMALGIDVKTTVRAEWDAWNLTTPDGIKVEVESSADSSG